MEKWRGEPRKGKEPNKGVMLSPTEEAVEKVYHAPESQSHQYPGSWIAYTLVSAGAAPGGHTFPGSPWAEARRDPGGSPVKKKNLL